MLPKNTRSFSPKEAELDGVKSNHTPRLQPERKGPSAKPGGSGRTPRAASPQGTGGSGHRRGETRARNRRNRRRIHRRGVRNRFESKGQGLSKDSGQTREAAQRPCKRRCHCNGNPQEVSKAAVSLPKSVGEKQDSRGTGRAQHRKLPSWRMNLTELERSEKIQVRIKIRGEVKATWEKKRKVFDGERGAKTSGE